jgi:hypothetical protein
VPQLSNKLRIGLPQACLQRPGVGTQCLLEMLPLGVVAMYSQALIDLLDDIQGHRPASQIAIGIKARVALESRQACLDHLRTMPI